MTIVLGLLIGGGVLALGGALAAYINIVIVRAVDHEWPMWRMFTLAMWPVVVLTLAVGVLFAVTTF